MSDGITADGMGFAHRTSNEGVTPKVWADLGEAYSITPANTTRSAVEFTHLKSPNKTREYKPGMIEPGDYNVALNYTKATKTKVDTLFSAGGLQEFQTTFPDGSTETIFAFLTGKAIEGGEVDGKLVMTVPMKVSGLPVFVAGT